MKRGRPKLTPEQRRERKQAMTGTERSRRSRERKKEREAAESATDKKRRSEVPTQRRAIRAGVEVGQAYTSFRTREGNLIDPREILFTDTWDSALEDERQRAAEADGTWPASEEEEA